MPGAVSPRGARYHLGSSVAEIFYPKVKIASFGHFAKYSTLDPEVLTLELFHYHRTELFHYHRIIAVHRLISLQLPAPLVRTIGPPARQLHQHETRGAGRLAVPSIRTEAGRRRLCYSGVTKYNEVITSQATVSKQSIKAHLYSAR